VVALEQSGAVNAPAAKTGAMADADAGTGIAVPSYPRKLACVAGRIVDECDGAIPAGELFARDVAGC